MNARTDVPFNMNEKVRTALITLGRLPADGPARIHETMRTMGLPFDEAAIHLGFITEQELADFFESPRELSLDETAGIVEGAILKLANAPGLPVEYTGTVKAGPELMMANDPYNPYSERIRGLRTELLLLNGSSRTGSLIAFLSPGAGEGRTQLCAELAIAFSQLGQRTLLVDADLRRPRVHTLFESTNSFGLGQSLAIHGAPLLLGVQDHPHLSLMTAGPTVPNPLELLSNGHFQRQMSDWRRKYQVVIIDTPPITDYSDGLAIASFAEQVVIVSRAGRTRHKDMKEMLRRLATTQSRIVGAVINRF